ncbi:acyltransferase [Solitalea canadensis]|nr:acyltransferase [Solitalea canadensis]
MIQGSRNTKYKLLSSCLYVVGKPKRHQPAILKGDGRIIFGMQVNIGIPSSPAFFTTYAYIDARKKHSVILIKDHVWINNNACLISEGEGITIGSNVLIGTNFNAYDSDFHELRADRRIGGNPKTAPIIIEDNVFIGSNVTVLKGVTIGRNAVIANGSLVTKSIPNDVIAGGVPCKVLKSLI